MFEIKEFDLVTALEYARKQTTPTFPDQQPPLAFPLTSLFNIHKWWLDLQQDPKRYRRVFSVSAPVVTLDDGTKIEIKSRRAISLDEIYVAFDNILENTDENIYVLSIASAGITMDPVSFNPIMNYMIRYATH